MIDEHDLDATLGALADADAKESCERAPAAWPGVTASRRRLARRRQWLRVGAAVAATLVIGFGLGRWSRSPGGSNGSPAATVAAWSPMMVDLQARSRGLLREVSSAAAPPDREWRSLAGELLWATRRLLDDPTLSSIADRQLLTDLESVLTQVLDVSDTGDDAEFELRLVRRSITSARLLDRLANPAAAEAS